MIGPNILLFGSRFFCKYGPDEKFVSWHQDVYPETWGLEPPVEVTVWYAIDDCDRENGCMYMIPGSHLRGIKEHRPSGRPGNLLRLDQEVEVSEQDRASSVEVTLRSGEVSFHHGATLHSSGPNHSSRRRCGLALRYVPTYVRQQPKRSDQPRARAILVRGVDDEKHFGDNPWPFPWIGRSPAGRGIA
jgi:ectoine hydroxylase-related dioxygenase (phytanoyl-CoA dioxygenase family)